VNKHLKRVLIVLAVLVPASWLAYYWEDWFPSWPSPAIVWGPVLLVFALRWMQQDREGRSSSDPVDKSEPPNAPQK
jgi:hypothetical protein